uniref:F-box associated domain-containing protein n=1 Tax=Panagrolaimus sp. PS1159 TaxID=55785 RepID=A0AC35FUY6_9BILA
MSIEIDFGISPSGNNLSPSSAETPLNPFNYLRQRNTIKRAPFNLLTIKNAEITQKFLHKWRQATNGFKITVIHVTFENCDFTNLTPKDVCNFIFGYIRAISVKIDGEVNTFLEEFFEDDRIQKLQNVRIICDKNINLDDKILLNRIFRPGNLQVLELRKIILSECFVNKFIQVSIYFSSWKLWLLAVF